MRGYTRSLITNRIGSKSLITNNTNVIRTIIDPIEKDYTIFVTGNLSLDTELLQVLTKVEIDYIKKMADRKYFEISQNMEIYLALLYKIETSIAKATDDKLKLLLEIARDGLIGSLHSRTLNTDVTELTVKNTILEKRIDDILSGKNEISAMDDTCGEFVITKTFKLAAVYSYYITLYGLPAFGVGFDTTKLSLLVDILRRQGIEPFR